MDEHSWVVVLGFGFAALIALLFGVTQTPMLIDNHSVVDSTPITNVIHATGAGGLNAVKTQLEYLYPGATCEYLNISIGANYTISQSDYSQVIKRYTRDKTAVESSNDSTINFKLYILNETPNTIWSPFYNYIEFNATIQGNDNGTLKNQTVTQSDWIWGGLKSFTSPDSGYIPLNNIVGLNMRANKVYQVKLCGYNLNPVKQYQFIPTIQGVAHPELTTWDPVWISAENQTGSLNTNTSVGDFNVWMNINFSKYIAIGMNNTCADVRFILGNQSLPYYRTGCNTNLNESVGIYVPNASAGNINISMQFNVSTAVADTNGVGFFGNISTAMLGVFLNNSGIWYDSSGKSNGTTTGKVSSIYVGIYGNAMFCGTAAASNYVSAPKVPGNLLNSSSRTVVDWVNAPSSSSGTPYDDGGQADNGYEWEWESANRLVSNYKTATAQYRATSGVGNVIDNKWAFVVMTFNQTHNTMYVNGTFNAISGAVAGIANQTTALFWCINRANNNPTAAMYIARHLSYNQTKSAVWVNATYRQSWQASGVFEQSITITSQPQFSNPAFSPASPQQFYYNRTYSANITVNDSLAISSVKAQWTSGNGTFMNITASNQSNVYTASITSLTVGNWSVIWFAVNSGNLQNTSVNYTYNVTGNINSVSLVFPTTGSVNDTRAVNFSFVPNMTAGISNCSLFDNESGSFVLVKVASNFTNATLTTINKTYATDGSFKAGILCYDQNSQLSASSNVSITIYTGFATISGLTANPTPPWTRDSSQLTMWNATINDSDGIAFINFELNFSNGSIVNVTPASRANNVYNYNYTDVPVGLLGPITYRWIAVDLAGNQSVSPQQQYRVLPLIIPIRATLGGSLLTYTCNLTQAGLLLNVNNQNSTFGFFNITNNATYNLDIRLSLNRSLGNLTVYVNSTQNSTLKLIQPITTANQTVLSNMTVNSSFMLWEYVVCNSTVLVMNQSAKHQFIFRKAGT